MSKALSEFTPVGNQPGLWSAQKGCLRCTALKLTDGSLCLYSPVLGLDETARDSLAALGDVSFLLAPNHYHHRGLSEYARAFPDASLICSDRARPRLEKQTGLSLESLSTLTQRLPEDCNLIEPDGLKTGEVWIVRTHPGEHAWVLCDAFKGPTGRPGIVNDQIELMGTFPTYGIRDKKTYSAWVKARLETKTPTLIVPCHGSLVASPTLASQIVTLLD